MGKKKAKKKVVRRAVDRIEIDLTKKKEFFFHFKTGKNIVAHSEGYKSYHGCTKTIKNFARRHGGIESFRYFLCGVEISPKDL